jgi:transcriptional regulator with XRE-family HTH domain
LPDDTLALKIIKIRRMYNLERESFATLIGHHLTTVKQWETKDVPPNPSSIKNISDILNIPLSYFNEYYNIYFSNYIAKIRNWKDTSKLTYSDITKLLDISNSGLARLLNGKINLSYSIYMKLKELKVL